MHKKYIFTFLAVISFTALYARRNTQLTQKLIGECAPLFNAQAVYPDGTVGEFNLKDYIGQSLVIYFYPMDNTPGCTIQAKKFRDEIGRLQKKDITVIGISGDSVNSHKKFQKALALPYPLVSDVGRKVPISKQYKASGFLIGKRITYLVDQDGIIFKVFDKVDIKNQVDDILKAFAKHA